MALRTLLRIPRPRSLRPERAGSSHARRVAPGLALAALGLALAAPAAAQSPVARVVASQLDAPAVDSPYQPGRSSSSEASSALAWDHAVPNARRAPRTCGARCERGEEGRTGAYAIDPPRPRSRARLLRHATRRLRPLGLTR